MLPYDSAPKFQDYAHPEMLVTTEWVADHLEDPGPGEQGDVAVQAQPIAQVDHQRDHLALPVAPDP